VTESGSDVIRAALHAHSRSSLNLGIVARELGVAADALMSFIDGRLTPSADVMRALTKVLFHGMAEWDSQHDVLKPMYREPPKTLGAARPESPLMTTLPLRPIGPPPLGRTPIPPGEVRPAVKRAGWAGL
jgi:hypothetical protein